MSKEIWRWCKFEHFEHYKISNHGRLLNTKTLYITKGHRISKKENSALQFQFFNKEITRSVLAHLVVLRHFKKSELGKECGLHIDGLKINNRSRNLKWATRGDVIANSRRTNEILRNRLRGVYPWKLSKKKWRAILATGKNKQKVIGYYASKNEAYIAFHTAYRQKFSVEPFTLDQLNEA